MERSLQIRTEKKAWRHSGFGVHIASVGNSEVRQSEPLITLSFLEESAEGTRVATDDASYSSTVYG